MLLIDWIVVAVYMSGVIALGLWVGRRKGDVEDYFLAGRNIPWWAALFSLVATEISAATFLGAPEQGYTRDFTYLQFGIGSILARFVLAFLFIEVYYKLRVFTVYGFLSSRFGYPTKSTAAGAFLLGRLFAGGSRLFIASLAVKVVTGFDMSVSIFILGIISLLYTLVGGIKAVIWTDVVQAFVLISGALLSIYFLYMDIPLTLGETISFLGEEGKLRLLDMGDSGSSLWSNPYHFVPAILGGFFLTMATHGTDQSMIQRLLTCRDSASSRLSMVCSGFLGIGVTILFMVVGCLLYVYVQRSAADPALIEIAGVLKETGRNGDFFLHYILMGLPPGISGLIIAAVIAAAMSSIDSELSAMSSALVNDFYKPMFHPDAHDDHLMRMARVFTLVCGFLLVGMGVLIADFYKANPQTDLLSIALGVMTLFYGALLGVFLVGLLTRNRGNSISNILGMFISTLLIVFISYKQKILPALGLTGPNGESGDFWQQVYHFTLGWPWFIIVGTTVTFAISALGITARKIWATHEKEMVC